MEVGIVASGFPGNRHLPIQVCSIGTLRRRHHLLTRPKLIAWDECHHVAAKTWADLHEEFPDAAHIGLSATPERLDGTGLRKFFKNLILGPSVASLIADGYLSGYKLYAPSTPDLDGVHTTAGDYNRKELADAMRRSTVTGDVITHYRRHADGKRMALFAWSVESSMDMAGKFNAAGIPAEHVDGTTDQATRQAAMQRFKEGKTLILCNVDLFSEGVDVPAIEAVALLRPTQSLALYLQQVGRALRPAPGKEYAVILDHAGNCRRFGLPDDDREWTLDGRRKGRSNDYSVPIKQCPQCYCISSAAADTCKSCGYKFLTMPREIEQVEGNLEEVDPSLIRHIQKQEQALANSLDELIALATQRGYKNPEKWAGIIWKSRQARKIARETREMFT
jgi:DNA repair protein RadD